MAMKPGLRVQQTQRLTLTPALRQSITILGLSSIDLDDLVAQEIEQNPLMVLEDTRPPRSGDSFRFAVDTVAEAPSLIQNLHRQITVNAPDGKARQLALYLAGNLTDQGYLPATPANLASDLGLEIDLVQTAVGIVQTCEPAGIGATDLRQCLDLQLADNGQSRKTRQIILDNLDGFANQDWGGLAKKTGQTEDELRNLAKILSLLEPHPAEALETQSVAYTRPDVRISANSSGGFDVDLIGSSTPKLRVDQRLFDIAIASDPAAKNYLQTHLDRSNALIRAIEARSKTILRVCHNIVATQHEFFGGAQSRLAPHSRVEMAQTLDLHPSTITRAIANKSLECRQGIFPLKFFFTSSLQGLDGAAAHSAYVVQQEIRKLVNSENPAQTLSDERITALLRQRGIDIRRRTVAKYRQCLNIPTSAQRRRSKNVL